MYENNISVEPFLSGNYFFLFNKHVISDKIKKIAK